MRGGTAHRKGSSSGHGRVGHTKHKTRPMDRHSCGASGMENVILQDNPQQMNNSLLVLLSGHPFINLMTIYPITAFPYANQNMCHGFTFYLHNVEVFIYTCYCYGCHMWSRNCLSFRSIRVGFVLLDLCLICPAQESDDTSFGVVQIQIEAVY